MALLKEVNWKGFTPNHWRILNRRPNDEANTTTVTFGLFKNKNTWQALGFSALLPEANVQLIFPGSELTKAQCYEAAKLPQMRTVPDPNNPGQTIEVDINPLTGAIDD